jgi:hypothetical protein
MMMDGIVNRLWSLWVLWNSIQFTIEQNVDTSAILHPSIAIDALYCLDM